MAAAAVLRPVQILALSVAPFEFDTPYGRILRSWGDVEYEVEQATLAAMSPAELAAKAAAQEAARLKMAQEAEEARMAAYALDCKYRNTVKQGRTHTLKKVALPCKHLYWKLNADGSSSTTLLNHLTGAECWAWERKKGSVVLKPHTCSHLHPNEPEWLPQWNRDRTYKPSAADAGLAAWGAARRF